MTTTVQQQLETADQFMELWSALMPDLDLPDRQQFLTWVWNYHDEIVLRGVNRAAAKAKKMQDAGSPMTTDDAIAYAASVMRHESLGQRTQEQRDGAARNV